MLKQTFVLSLPFLLVIPLTLFWFGVSKCSDRSIRAPKTNNNTNNQRTFHGEEQLHTVVLPGVGCDPKWGGAVLHLLVHVDALGRQQQRHAPVCGAVQCSVV